VSIKIKWIPTHSVQKDRRIDNEVNITHFAPEPAFKFFKNSRKDSEYLRCPAFAKALKNTFILRSPYDLTLKINYEDKKLSILNKSQEFYDNHIKFHRIINDEDPILLSIPPRYFFITDSKVPVEITSMPMILTPNSQFGVICGSFDITKWVRFVECAMEIYTTKDIIEIKIGDPLYMITFNPQNGDTVILEQDICTPELINLQDGCTAVKRSIPNLNLNTLYDKAQWYVQTMLKKIFK